MYIHIHIYNIWYVHFIHPKYANIDVLDPVECKSNPCMNGGTYTYGVNNYTCDCVPGCTGPNCGPNNAVYKNLFKIQTYIWNFFHKSFFISF